MNHMIISNNRFHFQIAKEFSTIWADLALCLEGYLFPNCNQLMVSVEELQHDEMLDVGIVHIIRDNILPFANEMPKVFVLQIVSILNRGSIHSATSISPVGKFISDLILSLDLIYHWRLFINLSFLKSLKPH